MTSWEHVNIVLRLADIVIEVLDAREIAASRQKALEEKVRRLGKKLLYVITKCDLVPKEEVQQAAHQLQPSVFISSTEKWGTTILKKKLLEIGKGEKITIGIVGYPNVGKSSLINALAGRHAARVSPESGFTKGMQRIRVSPKILLLDTPGVFPREERAKEGLEAARYVKIGAVDYGKLRDPETAALQLLTDEKERIRTHYSLQEEEPEEILEALAKKFKKVRKGGFPDSEAAARLLLKEWQAGKIR
ncbi:MAG TPA: GTPase [Candidatus Nanoarchaeia archaeon]|nr:GTPase [Candidatus Nanoarchaeia archaeon]